MMLRGIQTNLTLLDDFPDLFDLKLVLLLVLLNNVEMVDSS
jgi:hypothetical protein